MSLQLWIKWLTFAHRTKCISLTWPSDSARSSSTCLFHLILSAALVCSHHSILCSALCVFIIISTVGIFHLFAWLFDWYQSPLLDWKPHEDRGAHHCIPRTWWMLNECFGMYEHMRVIQISHISWHSHSQHQSAPWSHGLMMLSSIATNCRLLTQLRSIE